jgi:hypothetical protein
MSGRHRGFMVMSILSIGLGFALVACFGGDERCGRGRGHGRGGGAEAVESTPDFDATTDSQVSRVPADPQVGDPDASDPDADSDAEADASAD